MSSRLASRELVRSVLDGIFPPSCLGCSEAGEWLCESCLVTIPLLGRVPLPEEAPLTTLLAISYYANPLIGGLIRSLKYQRALCLEEEALAGVLKRFRDESESLSSLVPAPTVIVPLPMDPERQRTRGLDHALRLASLVQAFLFPDIPVLQALLRTRSSHTNATLTTPEERSANLRGIFACQTSVRGKEVLLIDDVYTTGATLQEAAVLLHTEGAASVQALVFAQS